MAFDRFNLNPPRFLILIGLIFSLFSVHAQIITSANNGPWNDANTWSPNTIPNSGNSTAIIINHIVNVPSGFSTTIDQTTVSATGTLQIDATGTVTVANAATDLVVNGFLDVSGTLINSAGALITGTTTTTATFQSGGTYQHQNTTTEGSIPLATWNAASNLRITGYTNTFTSATAGGNWSQAFGNVEWNCPSQNVTINLNGLLTNIQGNFNILATGGTNGILRFTNGTPTTVAVDGNLNITGSNRVALCTGGSCTVDIGGDYSQNLTGGYVRLTDVGAGGIGSLNITGDFSLLGGTLTENGTGAAQGNINFVGNPGAAHTYLASGTITLSNQLSYSVADDNELIVSGESQIAGGTTSFFTLGLNGILHVQSTDAAGAIQAGTGMTATGGNLRVTNGNRVFGSGSQIIFDGPGAQFMGSAQPATAGVTSVINNSAGVTIPVNNTVTVGNLTLQTGNLTVNNAALTVNGTTDIQSGDILFTTGGTIRALTLNGDVSLGGDIVVTSGTGDARVFFGGDVSGGSSVSFTGANSNLTFNGSGDIIFPLSGATSLENLTSNRDGIIIFNETLNVNTNAGASLVTITAGGVQINGDLNTRGVTLTNGSALTVVGNTAISNTMTITDGTVETNGTLAITNDLIITAGSLDANGAVTLTDDLTLGAGTIFYFEDQTVTLNSQIINNGGSFSSSDGSTLNILGSGVLGTIAFDPGGNTLGTFTLNRTTAGTLVTLTSALTISGNFNLTDGVFQNTLGLDFAADAVLTRNSNASFTAAPSSVAPTGGPYDLFLTGAGMTTGVETSGPVGDITSTSSGIVILGGALNASGNMLISSGTFTCNANTVAVVRLTNSGTAFNAPTTTLSIAGDLVNNSTFNANGGTVNFSGTSTITGSTNPVFQNILISGTLTAPTLLNLTGNFTNNGTFNEDSGTVQFSNTVNGTKTIGGTATTTFHNITVQNNSAATDVSIAGTAELAGVLTLNTGAVVDADGAGGGLLTLISSADSPTVDGAIATMTGASAVTGFVTVQRYMSIEGPNGGRIYRYIGSPVQAGTVADIQLEIPITGGFSGSSSCSGCTTSASMFRYNETTITDTNGDLVNTIDDGYEVYPVASNGETLAPGRGYSMFVRGSILTTALWDIRGVINAGNVTPVSFPVSFTSSGTAANDGWNLVANPFPSTIDWNAASGWTKTNLGATISMRDNGAGGQYATWNGTTGTNGGSRFIAIGQAFWVQATAAPTLIANENVKSAGTSTTFFREAAIENILRVTLTKDAVRDEMVVHFREDATNGFDYHADARKLTNISTFNLSSMNGDGTKLAINSLAKLDCTAEIKLDVSNVAVGAYTLKFTEFESFPTSVQIRLHDSFTGSDVDVRTGAYNFQVTSNAGSFGPNRFKISFGTQPLPDFALSFNDKICAGQSAQIEVSNAKVGATYQLVQNNAVISSVTAANGNVSFPIESANLIAGSNAFTIVSQGSLCSTTIEKGAVISVNAVEEIATVTPGTSCTQGVVSLAVSGASASSKYNWYESESSTTPIADQHGDSFETPVLTGTRQYFVSIVNESGCESPRKAITAEIIDLTDATISVEDGNVLTSNHSAGNQWYLNGQLIEGANVQTLMANESGVYKVVVSVNGCSTSAEREFFVLGAEGSLNKSVKVFPNPARTEINFILEDQAAQAREVRLFNSQGIELDKVTFGREKVRSVDGKFLVSKYPAGVYFVKVIGPEYISIVKIVKE